MPFLSLFQSITAQRTFLNLILARALCASSLSAFVVVGKSYSAGSTSKTGALESSSPNILLVVADDLGYSDLGAFGGEIDTPNLDALATSGIRFTNFYAAPNCSPSRSMLLTGQDNHRVGMGAMAEALQGLQFLQGKPGYEGHLQPDIPTIADVLSNAGYRTYMTGKWHLGHAPELQPTARGFDRAFVLLQGSADHYGAGQNDAPALRPATYTEHGHAALFPVGTYSSDFYAARMIEYLSEDSSADRPFFAYLAFTAPHWPLQAPQALIAKYRGRYDAGPDALRAARLQRMAELRLLSEATLSANLVALDDWSALSDEQRRIESRKMEIYAAMVDSLDQNVGRVLDHLRATGEYDNTVVIFMSDNGAEGIAPQALIRRSAKTLPGAYKAELLAAIETGNSALSKLGTTESFATYGNQWAQAAMAPFRKSKGDIEDGGVRVPAFISGPGIRGERVIDSLLSIRDVMPTVLDISNAPLSEYFTSAVVREDTAMLPAAKSWKPILDGEQDTVRTGADALAWELHLKRGIRLGSWKAVYGKDAYANPRDPNTRSSWRLYNLAVDAGESNDVSIQNPEVLERLVSLWDSYAHENGGFVPGSRP